MKHIKRICRGIWTMKYMAAVPLYYWGLSILPDRFHLYGAAAPLVGFFLFLLYMIGLSEERER